MSKIQELATKHGVEGAEFIAEAQALLTTAESKQTDGIPVARFNTVIAERNELRADKAELESKITAFETTKTELETKVTELEAVKTKFDNYQTTIDKTTKDEWSKVAKVFEVDESDANFERISKLKANYKFGEDLEMADIRENLKTYKLQESAGGFKDIEVNVDDDDPAKKTVKPKVDDPLAAFDN
jgi:predicted  nucleic acid-binding Zn-ribbon protein